MKLVINELLVKLGTLENNIPIYIQEGNLEQAELCSNIASEIRWALLVLESVCVGPVKSWDDIRDYKVSISD